MALWVNGMDISGRSLKVRQHLRQAHAARGAVYAASRQGALPWFIGYLCGTAAL
jgi:hypothetical protein